MSTSKLQQLTSNLLSIHCGKYTIRENYRPEWLTGSEGERLELDFFIEELDTALEIQGEQHHSFIPFFHGTEEGFEKRKRLDYEKYQRCVERGVTLHYVYSEMDIRLLVEKLEAPYEYEIPVMTGQEFTKPGYPPNRKAKMLESFIRGATKLKTKTEAGELVQRDMKKFSSQYGNPTILKKIRAKGMDDLAKWIEEFIEQNR